MGMFTAVFDGGGHESDQTCLSVAGFISTAERWSEFSVEWQKRLGDHPFWHHADDRHRRREVLPGLLELIAEFSFRKFGWAIDFNVFASLPNLPESISRDFRLNAYALCALQCVETVYSWLRDERLPTHQVEFIFDDGDIGKGLLQTLMKFEGDPAPIFRHKHKTVGKRGVEVEGYTPLQASDIIANELFRQAKLPGLVDPRLPYSELENMPGFVKIITRPMIDEYIAFLRDPGLAKALRIW